MCLNARACTCACERVSGSLLATPRSHPHPRSTPPAPHQIVEVEGTIEARLQWTGHHNVNPHPGSQARPGLCKQRYRGTKDADGVKPPSDSKVRRQCEPSNDGIFCRAIPVLYSTCKSGQAYWTGSRPCIIQPAPCFPPWAQGGQRPDLNGGYQRTSNQYQI